MRLPWAIPATLLLAVSLAADSGRDAVTNALARLDADAARLSTDMRDRVQLDAAQTLTERFPDLARKYVAAVLADLKQHSPIEADASLLSALAAAAPQETVALLPRMKPGSDAMLASALLRAGQVDLAVRVYRSSLEHGPVHPSAAAALLGPLAKEKPEEAASLFRAVMAKIDWSDIAPLDAYYVVACAFAVQPIASADAAAAYERVVQLAATDAYAGNTQLTATFQLGKSTVSAADARETLLIAAGARLHDADRAKFDRHKDLFAQWDLSNGYRLRSLGTRSTPPAKPDPAAAQIAGIQKASGTMRGLPTDQDRADLVLKLIGEIRALPDANIRASLTTNLSNLATEGDLGSKALTAIVDTMGSAMHETGKGSLSQYEQLASLIRYEHIPAPTDDAALTAASDLLVLREAIHQGMGFSLTSLDGKTYTLSGLKGRVVLLNFWATWCPPCRKEMPDMEKLYAEFAKKGFVVLAVSDEEREIVSNYIAKQTYTFPVLLDPGQEVHKAFGVEGIPKSFLFDRDGRIVAQAIDMRTERQFREMLKTVGVE